MLFELFRIASYYTYFTYLTNSSKSFVEPDKARTNRTLFFLPGKGLGCEK